MSKSALQELQALFARTAPAAAFPSELQLSINHAQTPKPPFSKWAPPRESSPGLTPMPQVVGPLDTDPGGPSPSLGASGCPDFFVFRDGERKKRSGGGDGELEGGGGKRNK